MGRAFPRRGRFQPYGWTCEWHKIDVIILSKSTDSISRDWTRVFATAFASQAKFRGGGAVRLFAINSEWCCSLSTSLIWMRFVVCFVWTDTAMIFLLQRMNHPRHSEHRTFPPTFPSPSFLERQQHQPVSCPSKLDVLVWSKKKTSLLRDRGAILAQGWSKQDLSFACHSPRCVNTCSGHQRGILPDCGHSEINAATLLNRISCLFTWHLIVLNKGQCVLTALPLVLRGREQLWLFSPSPWFQTHLFCSQVFTATFHEPAP